MTLIKCGTISKKLIYPIMMSITNMFIVVSTILLNKEYKDKNGDIIIYGNHPFTNDLIMFMAEGCVIIIFFIQQKITKDTDSSSFEELTKSQIVYKKEEQNRKAIKFLPDSKKVKTFFIILGTFALDLFASTAIFIIRQIDNVSSIELGFKIIGLIVSTFLSICILNYKYYRHHFIGCVILCIGLIIYSVVDFIQNLPQIKQKPAQTTIVMILIMIFILCSNVFASLQEVMHKYLMDIMFVSPFAIISLEGFFGIIVMSVSLIFLYYTKCTSKIVSEIVCTQGNQVENIFDTFNNVISHYQLLIPIIILFFSFIVLNTFRLLTNQAYSPTHRIIPDVYGCCFSWVVRVIFPNLDKISKFMEFHNFVIGFSFFLMMVGALIYLEIIELHFWGLSRNIRRTITSRQDIDLKINLNLKSDAYPLLDQSID